MVEVKISIIIPAYNAEKYLERCLVSLLDQNLLSNEYEIIVINDGSIDRTEQILNNYSTRFPNIHYVTIPNSGVSEARNYGCRMTKGKYFLFVDADDWIQTNVLQDIYMSLEKDNLDLLVMDYSYCGEEGKLPKEFYHTSKCKDLDDKVLLGTDFMQKILPQVVWIMVYRKAFWMEHNFSFLPIRHEDEELIPKVFYYAKRVKYLPIYFYFYYKNPDSFMMNYDRHACLYMIQAAESLDAFRRECVVEKDLNLFFSNLIAKKLLTAFRRGIRWGVPASTQYEMIIRMKENSLAPLPKGKGVIRRIMYNYFPSLFIAYYRAKEKKA